MSTEKSTLHLIREAGFVGAASASGGRVGEDTCGEGEPAA